MLETNKQKADALNQGRNEWACIISWWKSNHHWQRLNLREQRQENALQGIQHPHGQAGLGGDGLVHRSSECYWWGERDATRTRLGFGPLNWSFSASPADLKWAHTAQLCQVQRRFVYELVLVLAAPTPAQFSMPSSVSALYFWYAQWGPSETASELGRAMG